MNNISFKDKYFLLHSNLLKKRNILLFIILVLVILILIIIAYLQQYYIKYSKSTQYENTKFDKKITILSWLAQFLKFKSV